MESTPSVRFTVEGREERELAAPDRPFDGINRRVEIVNAGRPGESQ